jgi:uncharacterized protein (UPF0147 family)
MDYTMLSQTLDKVEEFFTTYSNKLLDPSSEISGKQVYFLDVQPTLKQYSSLLRDVINDENAPEDLVNRAKEIVSNIQAVTQKFKDSCMISTNVTAQDTTATLTNETIQQAVQTNKTTQKLAQDMDKLEKQTAAAAAMQFNYALNIDGAVAFYFANSKEEMGKFINDEMQAKKGAKVVELYEVSFKPVKLKTQTIVTLE